VSIFVNHIFSSYPSIFYYSTIVYRSDVEYLKSYLCKLQRAFDPSGRPLYSMKVPMAFTSENQPTLVILSETKLHFLCSSVKPMDFPLEIKVNRKSIFIANVNLFLLLFFTNFVYKTILHRSLSYSINLIKK